MRRGALSRLAGVLVAVLALGVAWSAPGEEPAPAGGSPAAEAIEKERQWLLGLDRDFGRTPSENNPARLRSLLADDAVYLGQTVRRGSAEFAAEWSTIFSGKVESTFEWEPLEVGVADSLDLAYTIGKVRVWWVRGRAREEFERIGHYLSIWQKNAQGAWKIRASGTLVASPDGKYGYGRERLRGLAVVWPPLKELGVAVDLSWRPEVVSEAASGEMAFTFGTYMLGTRGGEDAEAADAAEVPDVGGDTGDTGDTGGEMDIREMTTGEETGTATGNVGEKSGTGGYITLWRRDEEGFWVVAAEAFSPPL